MIHLFIIGLLLVFTPLIATAQFVGQIVKFSVDSSYDASKREEVSATLVTMSSQLLLYVDESWWRAQNAFEQDEARRALDALASEFEQKIYPILTSTFGSEWKPGIDQENRITALFHPMQEQAGGYTNYGDEYPRVQYPKSNEREMVYLNTGFLRSPMLKSFLAHELAHVITFHQKVKLRNATEETWLNEARAEYASTLLGYDNAFEDSNMERRMRAFIKTPNDSVVEWNNESSDYGSVNLFIQYVVDQYGLQILRDSLQSDKAGVASITEALQKNAFTTTFEQVFTNWTIAALVNNCALGERYCYKNANLQNFRVVPQTNFLPVLGESALSLVNSTKAWAGNWYKVVGGNNVLKMEFQGNLQLRFQVPYLIESKDGQLSLHSFSLDSNQKGTVYLKDFAKENRSVSIIPSFPAISGADSETFPAYKFSLTVSTVPRTPQEEEALVAELMVKIEFLRKEIARVQALLGSRTLGGRTNTCGTFEQDLYLGMRENPQVRCLQEFLKNQGPDVYPQGLVTGNFFSLTQEAVARFQEKHAEQILLPLGFTKGTGYFGPATRARANQLISH